jgi:glycine/D-amino acid oxidase-like deaminating enzyme
MQRRTLLKLLGATALAGCAPKSDDGQGLRIVVAGAGIIGASIAYHLSLTGASVTVIDQEGPATHASRGTFAWINATYAKQPHHYHTLSQESVSSWGGLQRDLGLAIKWGGSLEWFDDDQRQARLAEQIAEQAAWGEDARMIDAGEMAQLEPDVDFGHTSRFALSGNDGAIDPVAATHALLSAARDNDASVVFPATLNGVTMSGDRLSAVETSHGTISADRLVLATGAAPDAASRFAGIDIPQRTTPGIIAITAPLPPLINRIIVAPGIHMHQRQDGRVVMGEQSGPPQNPAHAMRLEGRPNAYPDANLAQQHASRMLAIAEQFVPAMRGASFDHVYIGWRPRPIDGHPVIGASPNRRDVYLAIMHSGVSLAPIIGQLAAWELTRGETVARLDAYRPGRAFETISRY